MADNYKNALDPSDDKALAECIQIPPIKTTTTYNEPGLPTPPAGWGKTLSGDANG